MLTDRFIKFLKVELNDFLGKYEEETGTSSHTQKKQEDSVFQQMYDFFIKQDEGSSSQQTTEEARQQAYQQYQKYRKTHKQWSHRHQSNTYTPQQDRQATEHKYYDALEIKSTASFDEIKQAYKKVMKKYHPDRFASDPEKQKYAQQLSQKINEAYEYFCKKYQNRRNR